MSDHTTRPTRARRRELPSGSITPDPGRGAPVRPRRVDPVERVLNLLTLLSRATAPMSREHIVAEMAKGMTPYPTRPDAQRQLFGADKNTISRDLGIQVRQIITSGEDAGQTLYFIDPSDMFIPDLDLTPEETSVLSIALASIHQSVPQAGEALMKFAGARPSHSAYDFNISLPLVVVRLTEATQRRRSVRVVSAGTDMLIHPWRVLFNMGTWYLIGHRSLGDGCESVAIKCSTLDDTVEMVEGEPCCPPKSISESKLRAMIHDARGEETLATVVFDEVGAAMSWWDSRVRTSEPVDGGGVRVSVAVSDPARFRGWLLGFGEHARVEGPPEIRDTFIAWLEAAAIEPPEVPVPPTRPSGGTTRPGPRPLAERLQRLLSILPWLHNVTSISVAELASLVGVDTEHLLLDLQFASMCGVPPYTHDALFDFWVEDGHVHFSGDPDVRGRSSKALIARSVKLTPRQATSVELALAGLEAVGFESTAVTSLRSKLASVVGEEAIEVRIERSPLITEVRSAVAERREVVIEYVNNGGVRSDRLIQPRLVFIDHGEAYLKADDVDANFEERNFRVDRILSVRPTGNTFASRDVKWNGEWDFHGQSVRAVLYLAPGNEWVLDRVAYRSKIRADDGAIFLWLDVVSEAWLATLLLRCGAPSCVIEPASLGSLAASHANRLLSLYGVTSGPSSG